MAGGSANQPMVERYLLEFARFGPARYLSHLDTARALQRTFARAGRAPALTQGLRPKPRLSLGLPLPVGAAALSELAVVDLPRDGGDGVRTADAEPLRAASPPGLEVVSLERCADDLRLRPRSAVYEWRTDVEAELLYGAARRFVAGEDVSVLRSSPKGRRTVDVRRYVDRVEVGAASGGACVRFAVRHRADGAARPTEVLACLLRLARAHEHDAGPRLTLATALLETPAGDVGESAPAEPAGPAGGDVFRVVNAELTRLGVVYDGLATRGPAQEWLEKHAVQTQEEGAGDTGAAV